MHLLIISLTEAVRSLYCVKWFSFVSCYESSMCVNFRLLFLPCFVLGRFVSISRRMVKGKLDDPLNMQLNGHFVSRRVGEFSATIAYSLGGW